MSRIAIIGAGNIGMSIANGLVESGHFAPEAITLTRRRSELLEGMSARGFVVERDNRRAVDGADVIVVAVEPQQIDGVLREIGPSLVPDRHVLIFIAHQSMDAGD